MSEISRAALFGKLNSLAYKAIEAATVFCKLRGNQITSDLSPVSSFNSCTSSYSLPISSQFPA